LVLAAGEAGIGKSRPISEAKLEALQRGFLVIEGHCFEPDRSLPYSPLVDALRAALGAAWLIDVLERNPPDAAELVKILPELALRLPGVSPTPMLEPEHEKRRLFRALGHVLSQAAALQPLLLVIEDLHWADATALEFLIYFARRVDAQPIMLLMSYRDDEVDTDLAHLLAQLDRERLATELSLARLAVGEVDAMLRAILDLPRPVRTGYLQVVYSLTEGNPFFIEEILRSLIAAGDDGWDSAPPNELHIPRSVQEAVRRRSQQLSPAARQVLDLAAVTGRRFSFSLLGELADRDEVTMLGLIKELIAAQLVVEESAEQFAFRHALTRQAIYTQFLSRERRALHARITETMERLFAPAPHLHIAELAYHAYEAENWAKALDYAQRLGEMAQAVHAPRAAIDHFTRAIEAAHRLGEAERPDLHRSRGRAYEILGDFDGARADYESALAATRDAGDHHGEWQALGDLGSLWAGREYARSGDSWKSDVVLAIARCGSHLEQGQMPSLRPLSRTRFMPLSLVTSFEKRATATRFASILESTGRSCLSSRGHMTSSSTMPISQARKTSRSLLGWYARVDSF
jgi:predicted ATPase